jgi:hypothetical protein
MILRTTWAGSVQSDTSGWTLATEGLATRVGGGEDTVKAVEEEGPLPPNAGGEPVAPNKVAKSTDGDPNPNSQVKGVPVSPGGRARE